MLTPLIAEKLLVRKADLTVGEPFPLSPSDVLGDGAGFFLCKAAHDGQEQFSLAVKRVDVFFFKIDLDAFFLQLSYRHQTVNCVPGETTDRLRDYQVDGACHGVTNHLVEAVAFSCAKAADSFVREHRRGDIVIEPRLFGNRAVEFQLTACRSAFVRLIPPRPELLRLILHRGFPPFRFRSYPQKRPLLQAGAYCR